MGLLKGCLQRIGEEEVKNGWEVIPGFIMLDDWRPFSYMAAMLDYKDVVEHNLAKYGCNLKVSLFKFELQSDKRYSIKIIKLPKFDTINLGLFGCVLKNSLYDILREGGRDYKAQFEQLNNMMIEGGDLNDVRES